jgi:predicted RNA methylase
LNTNLLITKVAIVWRQYGVRGLWKSCLRVVREKISALQPDAFDLKYGTDTGGQEPAWRFRISSPSARFGHHYETTDEDEISGILRSLGVNPSEFAFIDLGCGKGRTLVIAANLGFKHVVGVEYVPELAEVARTNLRKTGKRNASVISTDAADFQFADNDLVVYLFNPFGREIMLEVTTNLRKSAAKRLYVVYTNPQSGQIFDSSDFLRRVATFSGRQYETHIWTRNTEPARR